MSGLRLPDTSHAQHETQRSTRFLDRKQKKEYLASPLMTHVCFIGESEPIVEHTKRLWQLCALKGNKSVAARDDAAKPREL